VPAALDRLKRAIEAAPSSSESKKAPDDDSDEPPVSPGAPGFALD